jgi:branched-subunit amino acid transport protein
MLGLPSLTLLLLHFALVFVVVIPIKSLASMAIPLVPIMLLRNAVLMVRGHVRCVMALLSAMAFIPIVNLAVLVKPSVVIHTSSRASTITHPAIMVPNAVTMVSGYVLRRMAPTIVVELS